MADTRKGKGQYFADIDGLHPSIESTFGPWDSIEAFEEWLGGVGSSVSIPNGLPIAIKGSDGKISIRRWTVPDNPNFPPYWKKENNESPVIPIAGIIETGRSKAATSILEGNSSNVYYISNHGVLGLVTSGSSSSGSVIEYYPCWKGCLEYGIDDGEGYVVPFEGKLYLDTSSGQLFYASTNEIDPYVADDTEELFEEIRRLKSLNIRFSGDSLTLYDSVSRTDKTYNLSRGGSEESSEDEYGIPVIALSYSGSINSNGTNTISPTILVTQSYQLANGSNGNLRYSTVSSLKKAASSVTFEIVEGSDEGFSVSTGGVLSAEENSTGSTKSAAVKITVTLNGETATYTTSQVSQDKAKLYITAIEYPAPEALDEYTTGVISVEASDIEVTASDGETYDLETYLEMSTTTDREPVSFECTNGYGAEFSGSTGEITYNPKSILTNLNEYVIQSGEGKGSIGSLEITVKQNGRTDIMVFFNMFNYSNVTSFSSYTTIPNIGGSTTGDEKTISTKAAYSALIGPSISVGDIILVNFPEAGHWNWLWEVGSNKTTLTSNDTAIRGIKSSSFGTSALFKVLNNGKLAISFENNLKPISYKVVTIPT